MPLVFPRSAMLRKLWGRPPGLRGTPSSRIWNKWGQRLAGCEQADGGVGRGPGGPPHDLCRRPAPEKRVALGCQPARRLVTAAQVGNLMPLVFPVLGACINRGAVPLDRGRRPRRPARTLQDADPICSRCGTKASRADQGVCPTTSAALPTVEKRVALGCQPAPLGITVTREEPNRHATGSPTISCFRTCLLYTSDAADE